MKPIRFIPAFALLSFFTLADAAGTDMADRLATAALERLSANVSYDPAYYAISYPMGDVPPGKGVCTDVIIRSYRSIGIDLQVKVHEDMRRVFARYPKRWGLKRTDRNIDHRRVPNLRIFFERHGQSLPISDREEDYKPGDIVTWDLRGTSASSIKHTRLPHIGIVADKRSRDGTRPLIVHNIGAGPQLEDILFDFKITGHYRYLPEAF